MPSTVSIERQVADALQRARLSRTNSAVVVACSGGPDSTALLRCLHRLQEWHDLTLHVAHLNHDFRGAEADHDAAFVQQLADRLGLPCSIDKKDPIAYQQSSGVSSFEQAAREMRYSFLHAVAESTGSSAVALGHTSDDQAETVLMHLLRGSGVQGLRGMSETAAWPWPTPGPPLFRPLLGLSKADTAAYCRQLAQSFRQDSGNYMWRFRRNRIRLELMPRLASQFNPKVREALSRLSRAASDDVDYIDGQLDRLWPDISSSSGNSVSLDSPALGGMHPALQRHALRRAYSVAAGDARGIRESHVEAMMSLVQREVGGRSLDLPRGMQAHYQAGTLTVGPTGKRPVHPRLQGEHPLRLPRNANEAVEQEVGEWQLSLAMVHSTGIYEGTRPSASALTAVLRRDTLGDAVTVRNRRPGDRFQPTGMTGTKKLQDFFTDAKIPREQRDSIPLLVCDRGIAWVVGHRVAQWALPADGAPALRVSFSLDGQAGDE